MERRILAAFASCVLLVGCAVEDDLAVSAPDDPREPTSSEPNDESAVPSGPTEDPTTEPDEQQASAPEPDDEPRSTGPEPKADPPAGHAGTEKPGEISDADERVEAARRHVVDRFGHDPDEVFLIRAENVTWPSTALGCPSHEKDYETRDIPGYRIVLGWEDLEYHFHGAEGDDVPFHCEFLD